MLKRILFMAALLIALPTALYAQFSSNAGFTLLSSAARTATTVTTGECCANSQSVWTQIHAVINVSVYTAGSYTPKIQGKDPVSGNFYDLLVGSAINSTGTTVLKVGPGLAPSANASAQDILPRIWRMTFSGASSPNMTFSVGINPGE